MQIVTGVDLFEFDTDVVCITTNGFVKVNGEAVMGRGCAKQICEIVPQAPRILGRLIQKEGNITQPLFMVNDVVVLAFPVKHDYAIYNGHNVVSHAQSKYRIGQKVPGFHLKADINLIVKSAHELVQFANETNHKRIALPFVGCGAGELNWSDVEPVLQTILDDRFTAVSY